MIGLSINRLTLVVMLFFSVNTYAQESHAQVNPNGKEGRNGSLRGELHLGIEGIQLINVGPIIVYLDFLDKNREVEKFAEKNHQVSIKKVNQKLANFVPDFVVVRVGQTLEFPNNDTIIHNVFSYSKPNDFDLGLYPKGTSKSVTFHHPGVVRIYCSIHKSMNGTIFVVPTRFHTSVDGSGSFEIHSIPKGKYLLKIWNDKLSERTRKVEIFPNETTEVTVLIDQGGH